MRLLGVYLGDIYLLHVAIFAHLPKMPLEAKISSSIIIIMSLVQVLISLELVISCDGNEM